MGRRDFRGPAFQTVLTAMAGLFAFGLSAITGPLLARALGPSGRGDLAAVLVPSQIYSYLLAFGLPMASLYYVSHYSYHQLLTGCWAFAGAVGGVVALVTWWLIPAYLHGHDPRTIMWLRAFIVTTVLFVPVTVAVEMMRARPSMVAFNVMRQFPLVLNAVFIVILTIVGRLTLSTALASAFGSQLLWYAVVLVFSASWPRARLRAHVFTVQISYAARLAFGTLSEVIVARLDQLLLVGIIASSQLGLYAVSATAAGLSGPAAWGVALVLFPRIRQAAGPEEAWERTKQALRWTLLSSTSFAVVIAGAAPFVLPLLFGSDFRGALHPLWLLLPGQIAFDLGNVLSQKVMADNSPGSVSWAFSLAAIITVIGLSLTVGRFGIDAAAAVTSVSQFSYMGYLWRAVRHQHRAAQEAAAAADLVLTPVLD